MARIITKQEIRDGIWVRQKKEKARPESALKTTRKHHGGGGGGGGSAGMKKTERHNLIGILEKLVQDIQTQMGPAMSYNSHGDDDPSKI